ncbi:SHOCT domain-containing protein [Anaerotignum sp.]
MIDRALKVVKKVMGTVKHVSISEVTKVADGVKAVGGMVDMLHPSKEKSLAEVTEDLKRLKELKDLGILTEEEFEEKKQKYMEML